MDIKVPNYQFPELYYESYLVLLVRDPNCLYAYWELSPYFRIAVKQQFERNGQHAQLNLRVVDSTGLEDNTESPHAFYDIAVHPMADNYFIKDMEANRAYHAELGVIADDGGFVTFLRSNKVHTPRNSIPEKSPLNSTEISTDKEGSREKLTSRDLLIGSFRSQGIYGDSMV